MLISPAAYGQNGEKNKLVEFKRFGEWEIWCLDIAGSGNIQCNLNQVLRYKNHPDFRAMIPRFYSDGARITRLVFDREWQTSFARAFIQVEGFEPVSLSQCDTPCVVEDEKLVEILRQFSSQGKAIIRIHDYLVQQFDVRIGLDSFPLALESLINMQSRYR